MNDVQKGTENGEIQDRGDIKFCLLYVGIVYSDSILLTSFIHIDNPSRGYSGFNLICSEREFPFLMNSNLILVGL
jgi:hypothetical protein